jgi:hypothetical protein
MNRIAQLRPLSSRQKVLDLLDKVQTATDVANVWPAIGRLPGDLVGEDRRAHIGHMWTRQAL